jgi:hypothetical protein
MILRRKVQKLVKMIKIRKLNLKVKEKEKAKISLKKKKIQFLIKNHIN